MQSDPGSTLQLLKTLQFGGIEIDVARSAFSADGQQFRTGDYIIRLQQPWSNFAKTLLERQDYPDIRMYPGGPPRRPYDVTAHTLPMLMGVQVVTVKDSFAARAERASDFKVGIDWPGGDFSASDIESYRRIAAMWKRGEKVFRDREGNFYRAAGEGRREIRQPRIGLYKSHQPQMDEGWTRWLFDTFGWTYSSVGNELIRSGGLRDQFDVILFPDQTSGSISAGYLKGSMPDRLTGGVGQEGAAQLKRFAESGGTLIFLNRSSIYANNQLGIAAKNVLEGVSNRDFYCPGSLLQVAMAEGHPLGYGLPKEFAVWAETPPAWDSEYGILKYAETKVLASGWLLGEKLIEGKSAVLDVPMGQGRAILFGIRPQYRAQSYLTFKMLFNAILYRG
jgi:hypothetical protein